MRRLKNGTKVIQQDGNIILGQHEAFVVLDTNNESNTAYLSDITQAASVFAERVREQKANGNK